MPKVGMEPIRRRQLIDATMASIHQDGFAETTVASISRRAGVSTGIVHHYFEGKEALLEATLRSLLNDLNTAVSRRMASAESPRERIEAIIDGNFDPKFCNSKTVMVWLAFWARVPHSKGLQRLQKINSSRMRSNLLYSLKQLLAPDRAEMVTEGICALLDGLWVRYAVNEKGATPASARNMTIDYFHSQLALADSGSTEPESQT